MDSNVSMDYTGIVKSLMVYQINILIRSMAFYRRFKRKFIVYTV